MTSIVRNPFADQPRFFLDAFDAIAGAPMLVMGFIFGIAPCFPIKPLNIAEKGMEFVSTSCYRYTKNPSERLHGSTSPAFPVPCFCGTLQTLAER